jgi:hypothetical protein
VVYKIVTYVILKREMINVFPLKKTV